MNKYQALFRIRFTNSLQYRSAAFAGMVTQFVWGMLRFSLSAPFIRPIQLLFQ